MIIASCTIQSPRIIKKITSTGTGTHTHTLAQTHTHCQQQNNEIRGPNLQIVVSREDPATHGWVLMALRLQALHGLQADLTLAPPAKSNTLKDHAKAERGKDTETRRIPHRLRSRCRWGILYKPVRYRTSQLCNCHMLKSLVSRRP